MSVDFCNVQVALPDIPFYKDNFQNVIFDIYTFFEDNPVDVDYVEFQVLHSPVYDPNFPERGFLIPLYTQKLTDPHALGWYQVSITTGDNNLDNIWYKNPGMYKIRARAITEDFEGKIVDFIIGESEPFIMLDRDKSDENNIFPDNFLNVIEANFDGFSAQLSDINSDISDIQGDITTIQSDITTIQSDITDLQTNTSIPFGVPVWKEVTITGAQLKTALTDASVDIATATNGTIEFSYAPEEYGNGAGNPRRSGLTIVIVSFDTGPSTTTTVDFYNSLVETYPILNFDLKNTNLTGFTYNNEILEFGPTVPLIVNVTGVGIHLEDISDTMSIRLGMCFSIPE
jgi:hypothetical protein